MLKILSRPGVYRRTPQVVEKVLRQHLRHRATSSRGLAKRQQRRSAVRIVGPPCSSAAPRLMDRASRRRRKRPRRASCLEGEARRRCALMFAAALPPTEGRGRTTVRGAVRFPLHFELRGDAAFLFKQQKAADSVLLLVLVAGRRTWGGSSLAKRTSDAKNCYTVRRLSNSAAP